MVSKEDYKVILAPGRELLRLIENSPSERRLPHESAPQEPNLTKVEETAVECLLRHGVLAAMAKQLVRAHGPERVTDITEYIESQLQVDKRKSIGTPPASSSTRSRMICRLVTGLTHGRPPHRS